MLARRNLSATQASLRLYLNGMDAGLRLNEPAAITPARMVLLGVGWFGAQVFWAFHASSMPLFLKDFTDSKFTISLVLSLAGVTGVLVPPIVGYLSDRTFSRFGRRKPYIFFGMLGVLICVLSLPHAAILAIVALLAGWMYVLFRVAETTYLCLLPDITPPQQRATTAGVMNLVGALGLISCFLVSGAIWEHRPGLVFWIVALACFGFMSGATGLIQEPEVPRGASPESVGPLAHLKSLSREVNVLRFFIAQFCWWLAFWMISTFAVLFVVEELDVAEGRSFLVLVAFAIVAALCMLPMGMLGDRFGRKRILSGMVAFGALCHIAVGLSQDLTQVLITISFSAIPYAAIMVVAHAFFLDLIPRERTAEFVGIGVLSIAAAQICGPLIGGTLIDALGYRSMFPCAAAFMLLGLVLLQSVHPSRAAVPGTGG
jgi:MFS family permease